ncbi:LacI family DNA-binding transcriptional regulator [Galbitalea sp. SE-J8]|uniref:LacI family DNA-binding transcriptional regulator n=1 Tax=Galbitalea sp. SE-J8 TaxID=3054952 RepID=UPI00259D07E8|nr:LacI family DNA-binding transcriptional regulator [Galbitalea sp. SE-J8]MDM4763674.1 LacI family DNA-binding transcriptional regulator [Galbitalea sp. SE-J8]
MAEPSDGVAPDGDGIERPSHPVTMKDVARAAGVSVATVSLVLNNKKNARIGEDARRRVRDAIDALGYRPNALAQNLVNGSSRFIGLVADAIATTPFAGQIIHGAQDEAWRHGYVLLVANTEADERAEREAIAMMLEHKVRGILYSTWYHRAVAVPVALGETEFVLVNCFAERGRSSAVVPDEEQGGRRATELLLARGHRRIAFVNTTTESPARSGRLAGYRAALESAGAPFDERLVFEAQPDQDGGFEIVETILDSGASAVFCHNDRVAMGLYDGLHQRGVRVPADISVVGFDNQEVIAAHLHPPLSTVALPHYELGARGVRVLLGLEESVGPSPILVECPVVERESVAAP